MIEEDLEQYFSIEIRKDVDKAFDLYRALCDNTWEKDQKKYSFSWQEAGEVIAGIRNRSGCPHEDYHDYYQSGHEGVVAPWLEQRMGYLGYTLA